MAVAAGRTARKKPACSARGHEGNDPVIDAIVAIANALKMEVIAEGVESESQRDFLLSRGCTAAPGFLYGASVSAGELLRDYSENGGWYPLDDRLADLLPELPHGVRQARHVM